MDKVTYAMENYIKAIYYICAQNTTARISEIAAKMGVSKASASKAVSVLENKNLVNRSHDRTLYLTPEGMYYAALISDRHETIKTFFNVILNVTPTIADKDACSFEHSISMECLQSMSRFLEEHQKRYEEA